MVTKSIGLGLSDKGSGGPLRVGALRRFLRCQEGISSVEFVIILPLLMMFLFTIIAFGSVLYIQSNMENAAREAVRRLAVADSTMCTAGGGGTGACTGATVDCDATITAGTAEDFACTYLANWQVDFEVAVEVDPSGTDSCELLVTVTLPDASEAALADIFGFFDGRTLTADVTMREEAVCT